MSDINAMIGFLPLCLAFSTMAIIFGGLLSYAHYNIKKQNEKWQVLADSLGLDYFPGSWFTKGSIAGVYKGHSVKIWVFTKGSGKNKSTWTGVQTDLRVPMVLGLKIYREHAFSGLGKMLGFQDIQTGDTIFDQRFVIKGKDPAKVLQFLTPAVRQAVMTYDKVCPAGVTDDHIGWEARGVVTDLDRLRLVINAQNLLVSSLSRQDAYNAAGLSQEEEADMFATVGHSDQKV